MSDDESEGKTVLTEVRGWTPAIDALIQKYGGNCALVYGRVWRYCQGPEGICRASLETVASDLRLSRETVNNHLSILVRDGYIKKHTAVRNEPNRYSCTDKAQIRSVIWAEIKQENRRKGIGQEELLAQVDHALDETGVRFSDTPTNGNGKGVRKSDTKPAEVSDFSSLGVRKSDMKILIKKESENEDISLKGFEQVRSAVIDRISSDGNNQMTRLAIETVQGLRIKSIDQNNLWIIETDNAYLQSWCAQRVARFFEQAIIGVTGQPGAVGFVSAEEAIHE